MEEPDEKLIADPTEVTGPDAKADAAYEEDGAPVERELGSLRLPMTGASSTSGRGLIIGVESARSLRDIAWVNTIFEAAKFRTIRRRLVILRPDLKAWRRAPISVHRLVIVFDHTTSLPLVAWEPLDSQLRWAYMVRAAVTLIHVGMRLASDEQPLRARLVEGRNILAPAIRKGLVAAPGNATPLAHGLVLAELALRKSLQRGRCHAENARLVVVTDGRGNVPLEASRSGSLEAPVLTRGVDDARQAASEIGKLARVDGSLAHPPVRAYPEIVRNLALAMQAKLVEIKAIQTAEKPT